ncbi:cell wall (manno)protein (precursor), putative [Candida dubliniensis CD36]|uniref:Cell wall (Manno)protein (Precursor), putative n=1 Tax=Candida dubliniensis (strain CD36 / ATCC MYA-646 / CBS 7987 / NCPF 3949 / NRRL Y-17841) TaxID=573826 RepID=B9W8T1_CANDC|nr:cell wall (manno)protein (precursor), putative [Candida dubliniensis CD36]CAX45154.1 cell wall (manno)protein (precursor), putative [Candida dubliniensis CD36]
MQFQTLLVVAGSLVASTLAVNATVTEHHTTEITITSCSDNKCATSVAPAVQSVNTVTIEGIVTEYTTYCPLTASEHEKASSSLAPVASTESVVTTTISGVHTSYTTYCPLSGSESATPGTVAAESSSSSEEVSYVDVTSTPVVESTTNVELTTTAQSTLFTSYANSTVSSSAAPAPPSNVTTFEGGAVGVASNQITVGFAALAGLAAILL